MPGVNTEQNPSERQMRPKHRAGKMFDFSTPGGIVALLIKVLLLGIIDAVAVVAVYVLIGKEQWIALAVFVVLVALVNLIYLKPGLLPAKYLTPGLFFLLIFQVFVIIYTGYIAFTNAGDAHEI